jgi:hypothetical protein
MLEPEEIVQNDKLGEYVQNLLVKRCGPAIALYMWGICQLSHIQHNDRKKKDKRTNNDLQNIPIKRKIE